MFAGFIGLSSPARAAISNANIEASLKKAKDYIYSKQNGGNWEATPAGVWANDNSQTGGQWGGVSALATYALLAAGENPQDPRIKQAVDFLMKADMRGTYALSIRMQVWLNLPLSKEVKNCAKRDAEALLNMTQQRGNARGMHDYTIQGTSYSHSRSQYAVLAMWAAEQMGLEVPARYWQMSEEGWIAHQQPDGGWTYKARADTEHAETPGMTAAGVASLFITQDFLRAGQGLDCKGNVGNDAIAAGIAWLANNFDKAVSGTRFPRDFPFISLYAIERVGVAGGLKYFGPHDWYDRGANWILANQQADGSYTPPAGGEEKGTTGLVDTSFAVLFLARGRAPIAINKLDYTGDAKKAVYWNQRPREVANAVRWTARQLEFDLNWQIVNLSVTADELLDAPILFLAGSQPIIMSDAHAAKLKAYVEAGGMIVAHADCGTAVNGPFAASFRKLGQKIFPYEFRELTPDHVMFNTLFNGNRWKAKPQVQAMSNGARELMVLIYGTDPAKYWQNRVVLGHEEPWQLMTNIFRYTFERRADLGYRGDTHLMTIDRKITPAQKLSLARIEHTGNWDPEPGGWRRMAAIMNNSHHVDLAVAPVKLGQGKLKPDAYRAAHLTGTIRFNLDKAAIDELRTFVNGGGTLVIDAAGGAADFMDSTTALLKSLFPDKSPKLLPEDHPLYTLGGQTIPIVYRAYARKFLVGNNKSGRLSAIDINGRPGVMVSREDLSVGIVGLPCDGVVGYTAETATSLMSSILLQILSPAVAPGAGNPVVARRPTGGPIVVGPPSPNPAVVPNPGTANPAVVPEPIRTPGSTTRPIAGAPVPTSQPGANVRPPRNR